MIRNVLSYQPILGSNVYVDPLALVSGQVKLGKDVSIWPMAVLRGDVNKIEVGPGTNIQDLSCCHTTHDSQFHPGGAPLIIGANVTIGHKVTLHGCTIGDGCLIGIDCTVLDNAVIEPSVLLGAGSLVPPNKTLESGFLYLGRPAKKIRPLTAQEREFLKYNAHHYVKLKNRYLSSPE